MRNKRVSADDRKQQPEQSPPVADSQATGVPVEQGYGGHKAGRGRPRRYRTVKAMELAIDRYFLAADKPTVSGLALELGFTSRQALHNYEGYSPDFSDTIKRARLRMEMYYEEKLVDKNTHSAGPIFALKNLGWQDNQQSVMTDLPPIQVTFNSDGPASVPAPRAEPQGPGQVPVLGDG